MTPLPPHGLLRRRSVLRALGVAGSRLLLPGAAVGALAGARPALAAGAEMTVFEITREEDGVFLSYAVDFELGRGPDDALVRAVPLFFVAEADIYRERWWWRDARVARSTRVLKIVFQPLTSTYRVTTMGGLSQNYPTRAEAIFALSRSTQWKVAETSQVDDGRHYLEFNYRLDVTLLPRPMQIGIGGQPDWQLSVKRTQRIFLNSDYTDSRLAAGDPEPALLLRRSRWAWIVSTLAALGAGLVLVFLLGVATNNPALYERHYVWLFWVNVALASTLVAVIVVAAVRLLWRVARGRFGSRLLLKLAAIFALVGILPGVLIYAVSYQFVSRSIERWFDVKVEGALDAGLNLGRGTIDTIVADLATKTRLAAARLGASGSSAEPLSLERLREQLSAKEVSVVSAAGHTLLATANASAALMPERISPQMLRQARTQRVISQAEGLDEDAAAAGTSARVRAIALIPSSNFALDEQERFLVVTQSIAPGLAANALAVTNAYREYQQRALARSGLRKMYIGTLTLALVLAVFGALLLAIALSNQLAQPLLLLAEGVAQVARGDFSSKAVFRTRDELGGLTRSFAEMTTQLADARELVHKSVAQVEGARANLQTILDNLTAGVIVFDRSGAIDTVNPGATRIMRLPLSAYRGRRLDEVTGLGGFAQAVWQRFELHATSPEAGERDHWQDSFELQIGGAPNREHDSITLLVRGAAMPQGARLMVFDDITELVSAQRVEAWSEVARRLAHEIKNPLTPIQLSAERLQLKLGDKLEGGDQAMLERSVATIVSQVQAMKALVNEFRDYARLPASSFDALDVNALVVEVLGLYGAAQEAGRLHAELADALPEIVGDGTQLRQVIHNLVQNALDAVAEQADGRVRIVTEAVESESGAVRAVRLIVVDNGPGFSEKVLKRAFEPYVTTKKKGTGLGLAVVKKIADEHGARIRIANLGAAEGSGGDAAPGSARGAQVSLSFSKLAATARVVADEAVAATRAR